MSRSGKLYPRVDREVIEKYNQEIKFPFKYQAEKLYRMDKKYGW